MKPYVSGLVIRIDPTFLLKHSTFSNSELMCWTSGMKTRCLTFKNNDTLSHDRRQQWNWFRTRTSSCTVLIQATRAIQFPGVTYNTLLSFVWWLRRNQHKQQSIELFALGSLLFGIIPDLIRFVCQRYFQPFALWIGIGVEELIFDSETNRKLRYFNYYEKVKLANHVVPT